MIAMQMIKRMYHGEYTNLSAAERIGLSHLGAENRPSSNDCENIFSINYPTKRNDIENNIESYDVYIIA